ncbi:hypothetical protein O5698_23095 [Escherichia coli]|nr:hypothetical protein [Escherichia coli]MCZ5375702.1 hypothetical protein [Escherichia coli]
MGISVQVSGDQRLEDIRRAVEKLADGSLQAELLESIGAVVESQTRRRIIDEKTSPGGERWPDWSDGYKRPATATRACCVVKAICWRVSSTSWKTAWCVSVHRWIMPAS